jgi:hypothetical protein
MFIKKLYQYNKTACCLFMAFIAAFTYINYKWGITAAPILQFGMYSSPVYLKDTQTVYVVVADGETVNCAGLSLTNRDIIQLYPADYQRSKNVNEAVYNTMLPFMGFTGLMHTAKFNPEVTDSSFTNWYKQKLQVILKKQIDSLQVFKQDFLWQHNALQPIGSPYKLPCIVP